MNVMVACEMSGRVRDAFIARGHNAVSCDLLPSLSPGPHIQGDIRDVDLAGYELLIAFPPCTYLSKAGLWRNNYSEDRRQKTEDALDFVLYLMNSQVPHIAIENPRGCIATRIMPASQVIQPWQFGDADSKQTCLWLFDLPQLVPFPGARPVYTWSGQNIGKENPDRAMLRGLTYPGVARAMAEQWGAL